MNRFIVGFFLTLVMIGCRVAHANDPYAATPEEIEGTIKAVSAAYRAAQENRLESHAKVVVVTRRRGLIVVSFINSVPQKGGQSHVVYDPSRDKVVSVKIEE